MQLFKLQFAIWGAGMAARRERDQEHQRFCTKAQTQLLLIRLNCKMKGPAGLLYGPLLLGISCELKSIPTITGLSEKTCEKT